MAVMKEDLEKLIGKEIVIDTDSSWGYIGLLERVLADSIVLKNADIHHYGESITTREKYVLESRQTGVPANRKKVYVNLKFVVSFSLLKDIVTF
jgi:hypothetical protein